MTKRNLGTVLVMAGGTGGHVFPALAVAEELQERGIQVTWLGTHKGIEARVVPAANIPISYISVQGIRGKGIWGLLKAPILLLGALFQAIAIVRRVNPDSVLGMGGFASGPGGIACRLLRKPLVIHEQNAVAGTTNKILSYFANSILQAFPSTLRRGVYVGNPVRKSIAALPAPNERFKTCRGKLRLLILGGSLGAVALNTVVPNALAMVEEANRPEVWHQVGPNNIVSAQQEYQKHRVAARIEPFIENMDVAYAWADFVICRAGALTVAEISTVGIAALYVPYPHATDDHQTANAKWLVSHEAGFLVQQSELNAEVISDRLRFLSDNRNVLLSMANNARELATPNAASTVASACLEVCGV